MNYKASSEECSNHCGQPRRVGQRMCSTCHASYMKQWRSERVFVSREMLAAMMSGAPASAAVASVVEFPVITPAMRKPVRSVAAKVVEFSATRKPVRKSGAEVVEFGPMRA